MHGPRSEFVEEGFGGPAMAWDGVACKITGDQRVIPRFYASSTTCTGKIAAAHAQPHRLVSRC